MSFLNPLFFLGALLAAIPILLHLIRREHAQKIEFPTLMFLRRITKRSIRYQKLRHLLLLLLRILAILLAVLAFTRPFREIPQAVASGGTAATAHIILLDNSLSMSYGDRWSRAKQAAVDIINSADPGDKLAVLEFSDQTVVRTPPTTYVSEVLNQIENGVELTDRPTRYGQALKIAEKSALDAASGKRIIYLISDFQSNGFAAEEQDFRLSAGTELKHLDVGSDDFDNLALGDVYVVQTEESVAGQLHVKASVVNFGTQDHKNVRVSLSIAGRAVSDERIDIDKKAAQGVEFQLPRLAAGANPIILEVEDPGLTRDNRFYMTVQARGKTPVLAIEDPSSKMQRSPSFFLANALNIDTLSPYKLTAVNLKNLESQKTIDSRLVIWNNARGGSPAIQKRLQDFIRNGGGLVLILADSSLAADFNRNFASWLPVKISTSNSGQGRDGARPAEDYVLMTDVQLDHPIFRPFSSPNSGTFSSARFFKHARISVSTGAEVLARFDNGDPALVSINLDKGRILIFPSSADDASNDLALKAVYAPFWQQMLRYLENFQEGRHWVEVGDAIAPKKLLEETALLQAAGEVNFRQAIVVLDPANQRVAMDPAADAVAVEKAGFYEIRTEDLNTTVAVNTLSRESDLTHGNSEEMAAGWLSPNVKAAPVVYEDEQPTSEEQEKNQQFWRFLLIAALLFFLSEAFLSNKIK